ncbi:MULTISPECIES: thylakoid membrane photosystem I accumulation factor [unclassified Cyanobium]|uniref:Thioredoxin n=1 Tax=Aphanothece cf. minutissima CCALA 015 TaxID=2107695 RepID=A0ABX5FD04_9CHRO|nr:MULTISPECIES: thylakoid membrane photosystem I accumulation factor [unclassified Cyanobium]MCP9796951.1 thylakoid membrane photosystem I accumulation factor [Cyanobium sp. Lug-B]MCP9933140.1 thylakoid membrane photosystem I accumulation factor [Cyanobium sp. Candia 9D4]PSB38888.1 thioredoxin [Aphanothece cf. minutissima CCALA 015]
MCPSARFPLLRSRSRPLAGLWALLLTLVLGLLWAPGEATASLENDRYDGNIFALYAGNGSLVPPRSSLAQSLDEHRVAVLVYYLDDSSVSKQFSPVVSELQRVWGNAVDLIPLVTDPLQNRPDAGVADPAHYWDGLIPQVVVIDGTGRVVFDRHGQVSVDAINTAVSEATGIPMAPGSGNSATLSFNELNSEVVASR